MKTVARYTAGFIWGTAGFLLILAVALITEAYYLLALPFGVLLFLTGWRSLPAAFLVLLASIPLSAEFQFSDALGTDLPDEPLMLLVSLLSLFYITTAERNRIKIFNHPLAFILIALLTWSVISSLFSSVPLMSVKYLMAKSWYLGAFLLAPLMIWTNKERIKQSALVLAIIMFAVTLVVLIRQLVDGFNFAHVSDLVQPFFRNHVNYSALLVCCIPIWFGVWKLSTSRRFRCIAAIALIISVCALFFSYARGAWLALLAGILVYWIIRKQVMMQAIALTGLAIFISIAWLMNNDKYLDFAPDHQTTIFHEDFREHLVATYEMKDLSAAERFYRWVAGFRMINDRPLAGVGPGTFYQNYKPYTVPAFQTWVSDNPERSTVHNYFLLTAIEQGLPGLIFLLILVCMVMFYAQQLYHRIMDRFLKTASILTGVIFSMILTLNFLSDLIETDKIGSMFFLCIAALMVIDHQTRNEIGSS